MYINKFIACSGGEKIQVTGTLNASWGGGRGNKLDLPTYSTWLM